MPGWDWFMNVIQFHTFGAEDMKHDFVSSVQLRLFFPHLFICRWDWFINVLQFHYFDTEGMKADPDSSLELWFLFFHFVNRSWEWFMYVLKFHTFGAEVKNRNPFLSLKLRLFLFLWSGSWSCFRFVPSVSYLRPYGCPSSSLIFFFNSSFSLASGWQIRFFLHLRCRRCKMWPSICPRTLFFLKKLAILCLACLMNVLLFYSFVAKG